MDPGFLLETLLALLGGVPLTLTLTAAAMGAATLMASALALMRMAPAPLVRLAAAAYISVFRGTPLLAQIFLIYYGLGQFRPTLQALGIWPFLREPYWCALLALSLNGAAYAAEVIRGGLLSVPRHQVEAARSVGMPRALLYRRIVVPIALRQALPAYGSEIIIMVKSTSLASIITLMEITGLSAKIVSETFRVIEVFVVAGAIYLAINYAITKAVGLAEWTLSPHLRAPPEPTLAMEVSRG